MNFDIESTALLVVDIEEKFCDSTKYDGREKNDFIASRIADIAPFFRDAGIQIYAIHYYTGEDLPPEDIKFHKFKPDFEKDIVYPKYTNSAFQSYVLKSENSDDHNNTGYLKNILENNGHSNLLVCGVNLGACVKKTVLDGIKNDFNVTVLNDLVSSSGHGPGTGYWKREFMEMRNEKANICHSRTALSDLKEQKLTLKYAI